MEDLDALLADLQSSALPSSDHRISTGSDSTGTVAAGAAAGATAAGTATGRAGDRSTNHTTTRVQTVSSTSMYHTIVTASNSSDGIYESVNDMDIQPLYELQTSRKPAQFPSQNSPSLRQGSPIHHHSPNHHSPQSSEPPIYAVSTKQKMRAAASPASASGGGSARNVSTLSSNLSELDSLLQELSAAQISTDVGKRDSTGLSTVASNRSDSSCSPRSADRQAEEFQQQRRQGTAASSATRELDDLMASLSGLSASEYSVERGSYASDGSESRGAQSFIQPGDTVIVEQAVRPGGSSSPAVNQAIRAGGSSSPAVNQGIRSGGSPSPAVNHSMSSQQDGSRQSARAGNNLNEMMEDLDKNMTQQGVTTVPKGFCAACTKPIVGQVITALARLWHPEHFTCAHCREQIGSRNFFERDSLPYCERDYQLLFSPRCAYCSGAIVDKCVTAMDKTWHPEHFICIQCGRQLGDEEGFQEKDGQAYCREDYFALFAPKCGGCGHPITDSFITALSQQWHPQCFVCMECRKPFGATSFFDHEGLPYCETHFHAKRGSLCAGCHKPITGRCITAMYKKFHPEHFVCTFCQKQLNKGTFKEQNEKPYCHPCFVRLFG